METTMYDTLLELPLFQGLGQNDVTNIIEKVKMHFSKHKGGEQIIQQGEDCNKLIFLLKGELQSSTNDKNNLFTWSEIINTPSLIEPQSLFGMYTQYNSSYITISDIHLISIDKRFVISELNNYEIFRLNYLNILSSRAQTLYNKLWTNKSSTVIDKIIEFFILHAEKMDGRKVLKIKMEDLAALLDDTRLNVSRALNELQEANLVLLRRKEIEIPELSSLVSYNKL